MAYIIGLVDPHELAILEQLDIKIEGVPESFIDNDPHAVAWREREGVQYAQIWLDCSIIDLLDTEVVRDAEQLLEPKGVKTDG